MYFTEYEPLFANDNEGEAWVRSLGQQRAGRQAAVELGMAEPEPHDPGINRRSRPMTEHEEHRFQIAIRQETIDRARAHLAEGRTSRTSAASPTSAPGRPGRSVRSRVETRVDGPGYGQISRVRAAGGDARECGHGGCTRVNVSSEGPADAYCHEHN